MNYAIETLLAAKDLGGAGTEPIKITLNKPISRIDMTFKTTKAGYAMSAPAPANIPKIELKDGSTVLHSLSGYQNQALAYYNRPGIAMEHGQHIPTLAEVDIYTIDFGRYLWDELLAFDPKKFANPYLYVTWDEDVSDTSVTVNGLEVFAHYFDEKPVSPFGFLAAEEIYNAAAPADDSHDDVDIPDDRQIRQILLRAYRDAYEPWYQLDQARLKEEGPNRTIFDFTDLEMYYRRMKSIWPMLQIPLVIEPTTSERAYYVAPTDFWAFAVGIPMSVAPSLYVNTTSMKGGKLAAIASASEQIAGMACGYLPWHHFQFPLGRQNDPADWFDPKGKSPVLRWRGGTSGANGTAQVVVESLFRY